jgi:hypothetical protein
MKTDSIYLSKNDLAEIEQFDLSRYPKLERVRDGGQLPRSLSNEKTNDLSH